MNMEDKNRRPPPLYALDPASDNPGYWDRFCQTVLDRAAFELARRREAARESVATVLSGWSRNLIPAALAAAVIAAFLLGNEIGRNSVPPSPPMVLEDALQADVGDGSFQAVLRGEQHASPVAFMALVEGNNP